jgi:adenosylhomocysteine nucleosidase
MLADEGASALISFGLAGGLDPGLAAGFLLVPRLVTARRAFFTCDSSLLALLGGATADTLLAGESVAATRASKAALWRDNGASGIDLESGAVAEVAAARGLPFAAVRAICDPAWRDLPPAALLALDQSGAIGLMRVLRSLLGNPGQLPALLALAADAGRARSALRGFGIDRRG